MIMNNAWHHSVKTDKATTPQTKKADIIKWLENKNEIIDRPYKVILQLFEIAKIIKLRYDKYVIDELAKRHDRVLYQDYRHIVASSIQLYWLGHRLKVM